MKRLQTSIVFSERTWTGAGDVDDCWVLSAYQCVHACAPWLPLPGVKALRAAAGNVDVQGEANGGSLEDIRKGVVELYPELAGKLETLNGEPIATLQARVRDGHPVSVALMADKLPARIRYGTGAVAHQCTIAQTPEGGLRFANPMAATGTPWDPIVWADVLPAIRAYSGVGKCHGVVFPTIDAMAAYAPGVAELVAAAHASPDPAALAAAAAEGGRTARAATKAAAVAAVSAIPG